AALLWQETLSDEVAERAGEASSDDLLVRGGEDADDALDSFRRVNRMQRGQHEMAGFGGSQRDLDRLAVAHLANQDDLRRLAQRGSKGEREGWRVGVELALVDGGFLVLVQKLDRILDGQNVLGAAFVDEIDDSRQRG